MDDLEREVKSLQHDDEGTWALVTAARDELLGSRILDSQVPHTPAARTCCTLLLDALAATRSVALRAPRCTTHLRTPRGPLQVIKYRGSLKTVT